MEASKRLPMARKGIGSNGKRIPLLANHFRVCLTKPKNDNIDGYFYHYSVAMSYQNGNPVEAKGVRRKVIGQVWKENVELRSTSFAYDGEKSLFTLCLLPSRSVEYPVVLEDASAKRAIENGSPNKEGDTKRMRTMHESQSETINVKIKYVANIPLQAIEGALLGQDSVKSQEALRVLYIILRQHNANQGCFLVRQSFFLDNQKNYIDKRGGFHSRFRVTQGGLSLNMDVTIVKPGPVLDFLIQNQNVQDPNNIDWLKARRMLKNLRIEANGVEFKISGMSDDTCRNQKFLFRKKGTDGEVQERREITVYDYFDSHKGIPLSHSADMPCINVGKPKRPTYLPIELCELVSLQRYTNTLPELLRARQVENTMQKPHEREEPLLSSSGFTIEPNFVRLEGRVLQPPELTVGLGENVTPSNGCWNFKNKKLYKAMSVHGWAIVDFSSGCNTSQLTTDITTCAEALGMHMEKFPHVIQEDGRNISESSLVRVEKMYERCDGILDRGQRPFLLLCILPDKKNADIYGLLKMKSLVEKGIITQCMAAPTKDKKFVHYIRNLLLKINAKLGGLNSNLSAEKSWTIPFVSSVPTLILGMHISHGPPGRSDVPSIAAVVSSRYWPEISRYKAVVRTQSSKVVMIQSLFKPVANTNEDEGIIREVLLDFNKTSGGKKPERIIIFRNGVSESQFNHVLNTELSQIIEACKHLDEKWDPKFTFIVAQKNHHTRLFQANAMENVPHGTVVDNTVCHPKINDFYLCAQAGKTGTTRSTHYIVLHDEIGFTADQVQEFVHSLSYTCQRDTASMPLVVPVYYAHLAAAQMAHFIKSEGAAEVPQLPPLHQDVADSMYFC